jgi:hypothetical protein
LVRGLGRARAENLREQIERELTKLAGGVLRTKRAVGRDRELLAVELELSGWAAEATGAAVFEPGRGICEDAVVKAAVGVEAVLDFFHEGGGFRRGASAVTAKVRV